MGSVAVTVRVVSGEVGEAVMVGLSAVGQSATGIMLFVVSGCDCMYHEYNYISVVGKH